MISLIRRLVQINITNIKIDLNDGKYKIVLQKSSSKTQLNEGFGKPSCKPMIRRRFGHDYTTVFQNHRVISQFLQSLVLEYLTVP